MKMRFLTAVAAVAFLAACSNDTKTADNTPMSQGTPPVAPMTPDQGPPPGSEGDFVAHVGDRVFFETNKSVLSADSKAELAKWVDFLKKYPNDQLVVEGHCDERGTREFNLGLGERRANAVKAFLVANGIQVARLKTISYGKERPAVMGSNEAAWSQNRRGVGVIQ